MGYNGKPPPGLKMGFVPPPPPAVKPMAQSNAASIAATKAAKRAVELATLFQTKILSAAEMRQLALQMTPDERRIYSLDQLGTPPPASDVDAVDVNPVRKFDL